MPGENTKAEANALFRAYPGWPASKHHRYVVVSDSIYLGPLNYIAIGKIAKLAHPGS